jgi:hypothetical protein
MSLKWSVNFSWGQRLSVLLAAALLSGAGYESRQFRAPPDAGPYRARLEVARREFPLTFGDWQGEDQKVPIEAVKLLRPNFIISRSYRNMKSRQAVSLLVVNCQDARDTISHYPPVCYVGAGYSKEGEEEMDWKLPHMTVHGKEYTFLGGSLDTGGSLIVDDFFVIPGMGTAWNRDSVIAAAKDMQRRFYGVGQIQLVFDGGTTLQQREQVFSEVVGPLENLIQAIETIKGSDASATEAMPPNGGDASVKVSHE